MDSLATGKCYLSFKFSFWCRIKSLVGGMFTCSTGAQHPKDMFWWIKTKLCSTSAGQWRFGCGGRGCVPLWAASRQPVGQQVWDQRPRWSRWSKISRFTGEYTAFTCLLICVYSETIAIGRATYNVYWVKICKNKQQTCCQSINLDPFRGSCYSLTLPRCL